MNIGEKVSVISSIFRTPIERNIQQQISLRIRDSVFCLRHSVYFSYFNPITFSIDINVQ